MAVPLLLYLVGLAYLDNYPPDFLDHLVIGTTALSVELNAYIKRVYPLKEGNVEVKTGTVFAAVGALGNLAGANAGLVVHGHLILFLLSILMITVVVYVRQGDSGGVGDRGLSWARLGQRLSWLGSPPASSASAGVPRGDRSVLWRQRRLPQGRRHIADLRGDLRHDDRRLYVEGVCGACLEHVVSRRRNCRRLHQHQNCLLTSEDDVEGGVRHRANCRGCIPDDPQHPLTTRPSIAPSTRLLQNRRQDLPRGVGIAVGR